jgi:hypothetical protein
MAATRACCAAGFASPSLRLPPFHAHAASAAKFVFWTIFGPAKGTKHESFFNSFERRYTHIS